MKKEKRKLQVFTAGYASDEGWRDRELPDEESLQNPLQRDFDEASKSADEKLKHRKPDKVDRSDNILIPPLT